MTEHSTTPHVAASDLARKVTSLAAPMTHDEMASAVARRGPVYYMEF